MLQKKSYLPAAWAVKVTLVVHGPEQASLRPTPGRLTPMSCGTERSSFSRTMVTETPAGTRSVWAENARLSARRLMTIGPAGRVGALMDAMVGSGCAGPGVGAMPGGGVSSVAGAARA